MLEVDTSSTNKAFHRLIGVCTYIYNILIIPMILLYFLMISHIRSFCCFSQETPVIAWPLNFYYE